jgi:anti-sigma factor RsiW
MMKSTLPPRDWQALSDYLDGQLSPEKKLRLESRLKAEASLRDALDELRRTRVILRNAPRLRAPRNFTLTTAMVRARPPRRPFWTPFTLLRLSSATAALLLILVFLGDYLSGGFGGVPVALAPNLSSQRQAQEAAPATGPASDQASQFTAQTEATPPGELPAPNILAGAPAMETPSALPTLAASAPYPEMPSMSAKLAPPATVTETLGIAVLPTPSPAETPQAEPLLEAYPATESTPVAQGAGGLVEATPPIPTEEALTEKSTGLPSAALFRAAEIGLAALAILTGLAAFWMRRAGSI